jgi:hypothetical protein
VRARVDPVKPAVEPVSEAVPVGVIVVRCAIARSVAP